MSHELNIQPIPAQTEDNLTGIVLDGKPYLYWLRVYKSLGLTATHAQEVIKRLSEGTHYIRFTKSELKQKYPSIHTACIVSPKTSVGYFLTHEGMNRAILEIRTSLMNDEEAVKKVNEKRDQMANVFTRYEQGEVLSITADKGQNISEPAIITSLRVEEDIAQISIRGGIPREEAYRTAFIRAEQQTGVNLSEYIELFNITKNTAIEPIIGYYSTTDLATKLKTSTTKLYNYLVNAGYVNRVSNGYYLSKVGEPWGVNDVTEVTSGRGNHKLVYPKWKPEFLDHIDLLYKVQKKLGDF